MHRILIINSSQETMRLLERWLERREYDVKFTIHLGEVVDMLKDFNPKLIIIDVDQRSVIPSIKSYSRAIPLLLMTGYTSHGAANSLPVDDIIEKPFTLELLGKKVDQLMKETAGAE
ncbi:MAG: response regulator [Ginsengibacter sp.]